MHSITTTEEIIMLKRSLRFELLLVGLIVLQTSTALAWDTPAATTVTGVIKEVLNCSQDFAQVSHFIVEVKDSNGTYTWVEIGNSNSMPTGNNIAIAMAAFLSGRTVTIGYAVSAVTRCGKSVAGNIPVGNNAASYGIDMQ
jgi:hypothetical protein